MACLHFMEITVLPCKNPSNVVKDIKTAVTAGARTANGNGKVIWLFKIVGENRVLAFVEDCADAVLDSLNEAAGEFIKVACRPLRPYENFAKNVNKVDPELCEPSPHQLTPPGRIFYIDVYVNFTGHTNEEMRKAWCDESTMMLGDRKAGKLEIDVFKVIGSKRVLTFMKMDPDALDDIAFSVPLTMQLGDNCLYPMWEVTNMLL